MWKLKSWFFFLIFVARSQNLIRTSCCVLGEMGGRWALYFPLAAMTKLGTILLLLPLLTAISTRLEYFYPVFWPLLSVKVSLRTLLIHEARIKTILKTPICYLLPSSTLWRTCGGEDFTRSSFPWQKLTITRWSFRKTYHRIFTRTCIMHTPWSAATRHGVNWLPLFPRPSWPLPL